MVARKMAGPLPFGSHVEAPNKGTGGKRGFGAPEVLGDTTSGAGATSSAGGSMPKRERCQVSTLFENFLICRTSINREDQVAFSSVELQNEIIGLFLGGTGWEKRWVSERNRQMGQGHDDDLVDCEDVAPSGDHPFEGDDRDSSKEDDTDGNDVMTGKGSWQPHEFAGAVDVGLEAFHSTLIPHIISFGASCQLLVKMNARVAEAAPAADFSQEDITECQLRRSHLEYWLADAGDEPNARATTPQFGMKQVAPREMVSGSSSGMSCCSVTTIATVSTAAMDEDVFPTAGRSVPSASEAAQEGRVPSGGTCLARSDSEVPSRFGVQGIRPGVLPKWQTMPVLNRSGQGGGGLAGGMDYHEQGGMPREAIHDRSLATRHMEPVQGVTAYGLVEEGENDVGLAGMSPVSVAPPPRHGGSSAAAVSFQQGRSATWILPYTVMLLRLIECSAGDGGDVNKAKAGLTQRYDICSRKRIVHLRVLAVRLLRKRYHRIYRKGSTHGGAYAGGRLRQSKSRSSSSGDVSKDEELGSTRGWRSSTRPRPGRKARPRSTSRGRAGTTTRSVKRRGRSK